MRVESAIQISTTHKCDQQVGLTNAINRCDSQVRSTGATHKCDQQVRITSAIDRIMNPKACKFASLQVCKFEKLEGLQVHKFVLKKHKISKKLF